MIGGEALCFEHLETGFWVVFGKGPRGRLVRGELPSS